MTASVEYAILSQKTARQASTAAYFAEQAMTADETVAVTVNTALRTFNSAMMVAKPQPSAQSDAISSPEAMINQPK